MFTVTIRRANKSGIRLIQEQLNNSNLADWCRITTRRAGIPRVLNAIIRFATLIPVLKKAMCGLLSLQKSQFNDFDQTQEDKWEE